MLSQVVDRAELTAFLNNTYSIRSKKALLSSIILHSKIIPEEMMEIINKRKYLKEQYRLRLKPLRDDLFKLTLTRYFNNKTLQGFLIIDTSIDNVWIVTTDEKKYFVTYVAERLFEHLYPNLSRLYLNTTQMKELLSMLEKRVKGYVSVNYFSGKIEPRPDTLFLGKRRKGSIQRWKADATKELDELSKTYRVSIRHLSFNVYDENKYLNLECQISREGLCRLKYGFYHDFYELVIKLVIKVGYELKNFYGNREPYIIEGFKELNPIQIIYKLTFNITQLKLLEKKLSSKYLCSVIHSGNPYFAANLSDYEDGSSFGLTVLKNKVTITPLIKGSSESVWKLVNSLQIILGDGNIVNYRT